MSGGRQPIASAIFERSLRSIRNLIAPPTATPTDDRTTREVHERPHFVLYDPDSLHFPDAQGPLIRHNGSYHSAGIEMINYDHQPMWNRDAADMAGPVRKFFRRMTWDNRIKSAG